MRKLLIFMLAGVALSMQACTPYRLEVPQGNVVEAETVAKLQPGMSGQQVRFLMGTPLLVDPFQPDRWDYLYLRPGPDGKIERQHVVLYFDEDRLVRVEQPTPTPAD